MAQILNDTQIPQRLGAPTGMTNREWAVALEGVDGDREFEALLAAGYPWGNFARKLKETDEHMGSLVTRADLDTSIRGLENKFRNIIVSTGTFMGAGALTVLGSPDALLPLIKQYGFSLGLTIIAALGVLIFIRTIPKKHRGD